MASDEQNNTGDERSISNKTALTHINLVQQASGINNWPINNNREQVSDVTGNQQKPSISSQVKVSSFTMLDKYRNMWYS